MWLTRRRLPASRTRSYLRTLSSLLLLILTSAPSLSHGASLYRNTGPGVAYLGSKGCAGCHKKIYDSYLRTAMGRSMSLPEDASHLKVNGRVTVPSFRSNRVFQVYRDGPALFQSQFE